MTRRRIKNSTKQGPLSKLLSNTKVLASVLSVSILGVLFVLIRMKGIEQDYKFNELASKMKHAQIENKELKAKKADSLSVNNLRKYASKFGLKDPDEKHIIIVPK